MEIKQVETGRLSEARWQVESESHPGTWYNVRSSTKLDEMGSMYFKMTCDCPSRKHPCKHIIAIEDARINGAETDEELRDAMEIMERAI